MEKTWILCPLLLLTCLLSGCYTSKVRVVLQPDGSGTLVVTHTGTEALLSFIETRFKSTAEETFFKEDQLKAAAASYGKGVSFVRRNIFDTEDGKAFIATYKFNHVNDLRIGADTAQPGKTTSDNDDAFTFLLTNTLLLVEPPVIATADVEEGAAPRIELPEVTAKRLERFQANRTSLMEQGNPFSLEGDESQAVLTKKLLQDMRFRVEISVPGQIRATNASHLERTPTGDQVVVLLDLQLGRMLDTPTFMTAIAEDRLGDLSISNLVGLPGVTTETNGTVRIMFDPSPTP